MGRTIIQPIGPLYGEDVNGTVFGRPNGSIYVPSTNLMSITLGALYRYITPTDGGAKCSICASNGAASNTPDKNVNFVAEAQDLSSYVQLQLYDDSDCTNLIAYWNRSAGDFNNWGRTLTLEDTLVNGQTYYLRAQLMNNGTAVATSNVIEVEGVVSA